MAAPERVPDGVRERVSELLEAFDPEIGADAGFRGRQFDLGLAWVHHPEGEGGLGVDARAQHYVDDTLAAAGIGADRWRAGVGLLFVAHTLAACATEEQRRRFLRPMFTGEEIWCQLFSEPGAGSDLAGLATRAIRTDDGWVVNGQKVWTSHGHLARWGILCARTDPDQPKHKGLTYFILDMGARGIDVRPLRQMTGEAEFDEVFLTDVAIPDRDRVGEVGQGWAIMLTTLGNERAAFSERLPARGDGPIGRVLELWHEHGAVRQQCRDQVLELAVLAEVLRLSEVEAFDAESRGAQSPAMSFIKLVGSEFQQRVYDLALTLRGPDGLCYGDYTLQVRDQPAEPEQVTLPHSYLLSRALTIAGGTSEVQRTIIADRVLGLPREPQHDRGVPWREIPRN